MHRLDNLLEQMGQNFPQNAVVFRGKLLTNCGRRSRSGRLEFVTLCVDEVVKHEYLECIRVDVDLNFHCKKIRKMTVSA